MGDACRVSVAQPRVYPRLMARLWTADYVIQWTPILTFTRRRVTLLEWLDKHVEPVAFTDQPERVGVAIVTSDLRLMVNRSRMIVSTGLSGGRVEDLETAIGGVFEVLEPQGAVGNQARSTLTCDLSEVDYNEERARLAAKYTGSTNVGGLRPLDGSGLVDLESPELTAQVEWGVVEHKELLFRLTHRVGRLPDRVDEELRTSRAPREVEQALRGRLEEAGVEVSLLVDVALDRRVGGLVSDASAVLDLVAQTNETSAGIAESLLEGFAERKEGQQR